MRTVLIPLISVVVLLLFSGSLRAEADSGLCSTNGKDREWCRNNQGGVCDKRLGGSYGARRSVKSIEEARAQVDAYYADRKDVVIGKIEERRWGFEAEILDRNNKSTDRLMIHRKTGRIRSIY